MIYHKTCKQCGKEFIAKRQHAECCSGNCRARYSQGLAPKTSKRESESESAQTTYSSRVEELLEQNNYLLSMIVDAMQRGFVFQGVAVPTPQQNFSPPSNLLTQGEGKKSEPPKVVFDESAARARTVANSLAAIEDF